ncbi:hypothetical protein JCM3774_003457 [Rhodotorula dairenensis]
MSPPSGQGKMPRDTSRRRRVAPYPTSQKAVKRRHPCNHCRERRSRCVPAVRVKSEFEQAGAATNTATCEKCQTEGLECTYGEIERNWQGRQRSYGTLSDLNQRLSKLEAKLTAKFDEVGYLAMQPTETVHTATTADVLIGPYANDRIAGLSAAFEFASAFWPADPGDATTDRIGFTDAFVGRSYLCEQLTKANALVSAQASCADQAGSRSSPSRPCRQPSLASSVSSIPSDVTEPRTPQSLWHVRDFADPNAGREAAICTSAPKSSPPLPGWTMPPWTPQNGSRSETSLPSDAARRDERQNSQHGMRLLNILNPVQSPRPPDPFFDWHPFVPQPSSANPAPSFLLYSAHTVRSESWDSDIFPS